LKITNRKSEIVWHYKVTLDDGFVWDARDLLETLREVGHIDIYINNRSLGDELVKLEVLETAGSGRWCEPARMGKHYETFVLELANLVDDADNTINYEG
jgi:hypothetical protein